MADTFSEFVSNALGIPFEEKMVLDHGSNHPFHCKCEVCKRWWKLMGPENADEKDDPWYEPQYGPFTKEEIECAG